MEYHPPRFNAYSLVHKGLRAMMSQTLLNLGRTDWSDAADSAGVLGQVRDLLDFCESHSRHENDFVHPAVEERLPGLTAKLAEDHRRLDRSIAVLHAQLAVQEARQGAARIRGGEVLYLDLTAFVADNLQHMHFEETEINLAMWAAYSDADIMAVQRRLVASLSPQEAALGLRRMLPYASPGERAAMLGELRSNAPAAVFEGILGMLRQLLSGKDWRKLSEALDLEQAA